MIVWDMQMILDHLPEHGRDNAYDSVCRMIEAAVKEEREACKLIVRQASLVGMRRIPTEEDRAAFKAIGNTCQRIIANIDKRGQE